MAYAGQCPGRQHTATTQARFTLGEHDLERVPKVIGDRYQVGRFLGRGATARVFRAYDRLGDRQVAIKLFHPGAVAVEQRRRLKEIEILRALQHPGLVTLYDAGTAEGLAFLAMKLVEGPNLADRIDAGPLGAAEVTDLTARLAAALAYVHDRGVTHRDLKPANVLLDSGSPLISDFGTAQAFDSTRVTAPGTVVGTVAYMAPEQVLGEEVGPPADIYALGLVLLECLTGVREYGGTMVESAICRLHRPPRMPAGLPHRLQDLLRQMTAQRPADRPSAQALLSAMRDGKRTGILPPTSLCPASRLKRHGRTLLVAGIPAVVALVTVSATVIRLADDGPAPSQPVISIPASPAPEQPSSTPPPSPTTASQAVEALPPVTTPPVPAHANDKVKKPKSNGNAKTKNKVPDSRYDQIVI
jgi:serine/threonine protein kinase